MSPRSSRVMNGHQPLFSAITFDRRKLELHMPSPQMCSGPRYRSTDVQHDLFPVVSVIFFLFVERTKGWKICGLKLLRNWIETSQSDENTKDVFRPTIRIDWYAVWLSDQVMTLTLGQFSTWPFLFWTKTIRNPQTSGYRKNWPIESENCDQGPLLMSPRSL